jgi:hypothetical protein
MTVTISRSAQKMPPFAKHVGPMVQAMFAVMAFRDLDEHLLEDIGITRQDATIEVEKPVWDVPHLLVKICSVT